MSLQIRGDLGGELHLGKDVLLQVDTWGDLDQDHLPVFQLEDGPLGDIEHVLARLGGVLTAERDLLHRFLNFLRLAFLGDGHLPFADVEIGYRRW